MGPFGSVYARFVERGYSVLPIMPGTKKPGLPCNNNGEWMDFPGWTTFQPTLVHLKLWALSSAGIAVLCGPPSGCLIAVDIDTDDPGIIEALCRILPATPVKKKGARGESWFYFGPGISSRAWLISGRKVVEIIGPGRQTVLPPTIHPDLGEPYRWTGSKTLEELRPQDLPQLPIATIGQIDAVLAPFGYEPPALRERTSCDECDAADDPHRRLNQAALDNLDAWVPALDLYRCRPGSDMAGVDNQTRCSAAQPQSEDNAQRHSRFRRQSRLYGDRSRHSGARMRSRKGLCLFERASQLVRRRGLARYFQSSRFNAEAGDAGTSRT
jgi:hypothetical protein